MIHNGLIVERPVDARTLTRRYTERAVDYIKEHKDGPFFLYLAHSMPHVPLLTNDRFAGTSRRGLFGDVVEEIDWSVGQVLNTLRELGIDKNTLVVFTSDNGPWKLFNEFGGSAGILRGEKGATFEGGMREPTIIWWPGKIQPGVIQDLGSTLDLLPTLCALAGAAAPADRRLDGYDLSPTLLRGEPGPRDTMIYYRGVQVWAVRKGAYKMHLVTKEPAYGPNKPQPHDPPLLFNLEVDPSEQYNIARGHEAIINALQQLAQEHRKTVKAVPNQLEMR
jgi:arylsulfatase A-like enzyme